MLRVGRLISDTILVTDTMVLDGKYFMRLGPEGVLRELGVSDGSFPLTITGQSESLAAGLEARLNNPDFQWSLADSAKNGPAPYVFETWKSWIAFVERGLIKYERQTQVFTLPETNALPEVLRTESTATLATELKKTTRRGVVFKAIENSVLSGRQQTELKNWWNARYLVAIAQVAQADWLSFDDPQSAHHFPGTAVHSIPLPHSLLKWAKNASPATIGIAWDTTVTQRRKLQRRNTRSAMRSLAFGAMQVTTHVTRTKVTRDSLLKLALSLILIIVGSPFLGIEHQIDNLPWLAFMVLVISTLPYKELIVLKENLRPDPHSTLMLYEIGQMRTGRSNT